MIIFFPFWGDSLLKFGFFWKKSEGGVGGHFRHKKCHCRFICISNDIFFVVNFGKNIQKGGRGGVIANPKNLIANLRILTIFYNFIAKLYHSIIQGRWPYICRRQRSKPNIVYRYNKDKDATKIKMQRG